MAQIRLREWSEAPDVALTFEEVAALRRIAGSALEILPGSRRDHWTLRSKAQVGAIRLDDLTIHIHPKVPLENVLYMMSVGQTDIDFGTSLVGYEHDELLPALAVFYQRLLTDTLNRGVLKAYVEHTETLVALRGRIDIPAVIHGGGMPAPIPCRFDELSVDIAENRILRTAALALATYPEVHPAVRRGLRRTVGAFDGVGVVDPRAIPQIHYTRLNRYYEPALRMAEVILRSGGIRDRAGRLEASAFLIDINRLFERFVTVQLQRRLAGKLEVRAQEQIYLDVERRIPMRPDLVFYRRGVPVLVADVKYKLTDDGLNRNEDYYQMIAYCRVLGLERAFLIHPTEGEALGTEVTVAPRGPILASRSLRLGGAPANTAVSLDELADEICSARLATSFTWSASRHAG